MKKKLLFITGLCFILLPGNAQKDSAYNRFKLSGTASVTNNGISLIPTYSLDKPAISAFFKLKKGRLSYESDVNFSLTGRPWGIGHFLRYMAIDNKKISLKTGGGLGLGFTYPEVIQDGKIIKVNKAERYIWLELMPSYKISEKVTLSSTTWNGHNLEENSVKVINFLSLAASVSKIQISEKLYSNIYPQVFYLNIDHKSDGFFFSTIAGIAHKDLPLFLSSQVTATLQTNMSPDPGFKWNISLIYSF